MADLTRSEAWELLTKYNKEPFHLRHALTVEGIMKYNGPFLAGWTSSFLTNPDSPA